MTIVALLKADDGFLYVGADSQWTDTTGLKHYKNKLRHLYGSDTPIAWGTAGNPQIGITEFGDWIAARTWAESESWQDFIVDAATEFARLNAIRKKIGEDAGQDIGASDFINQTLCEMLLCGWIGDHVGAYTVDQNGSFQSIDTLGSLVL